MNLLNYEGEMVIQIENPLRKKDNQFLYMQQLIEEKRNMLLEKQRKLRKAAKQNEFLQIVKNDYAKYYNYIAEQKRQQIQAFEILNKYIDDLNSTNKLSKYNIEDAKVEQKKIMGEITSIKKGLDEIIGNETILV
jgi:hypothetical protein